MSLNILKILYGENNKQQVKTIPVKSSHTNWKKLSDKFLSNFSLASRIPVGKVRYNGFEFKLNYPNYYIIVPNVVVKQDGDKLSIVQNYDSKTKILQNYWVSLWVFSLLFITVMTLWDIFDPPPEPSKVQMPVTAFFLSLICFVLFIYVRIRKKLWKESIDKTTEILTLFDINLSENVEL